ncbi:MAG: histidine--tRNA ligase [Deltaproteobacteria bacterium]|nr:MAG: histidine--tRNA ligase [Deltaproteobacteria bacterium]
MEAVVKIKALKGFKDILPGEVELWQKLENTARSVFRRYNFSEIRLPILEETRLFARSIGEGTDIVEKEMYTFTDKQITMRPEATASLLRAYLEHGLYVQKPVQRFYTIGPMFRHERPQKGRLRQFHQLDVEILGSEHARTDAELISLSALLLDELGIKTSLELNSLGCAACRPGYRETLLAYIAGHSEAFCGDCQRRSQVNPLRLLDCKNATCREQIEGAPSILDHLCDDCARHFDQVQEALQMLGLGYRLNKFMVRGLDYYCRTTFEFISTDLGAQAAVAAGGRYDGLVEILGGPEGGSGIGFAMGMERMILLMQAASGTVQPQGPDLFIAGIGEEGSKCGYVLAHGLRAKGFSVALDHQGRSLKAQMKLANKEQARYAFIIGDREMSSGLGVLKNMQERGAEQQSVPLQVSAVAELLG